MNDSLGLRICLVVGSNFFLRAQLLPYVSYLNDRGDTVTVVSESPVTLPDGVTHISLNFNRKPSLSDPFTFLALSVLLRNRKFDVVHSFTPKVGFLTCLAAWLARIPIRVHTFTGQVWVNNTGLSRYIYFFCDKIIGSINTHCLADSRTQLAFLRDNQILRRQRSSVIGCGSISGISETRFSSFNNRNWLDLPLRFDKCELNSNITYVFLGRICADKGIATLLDAFEIVLANFKRSDLQLPRLLIAGPVEDSNIAQLIANSNSNVVFQPGTHAPEAILGAGDIFCSASHREGFGTTVIEAAFMGLPAIGSDIVGFRDAIVDGFTGLLVRRGDALALANAMMKLGLDNEERLRLGRNAALRSRLAYQPKYYLPEIRDRYVVPK